MEFIVLGIFLSAILFGLLGLKLTKIVNKPVTWNLSKKQFLAPLGLLVIFFGCFSTVGANQVGIVFNPISGGLQDQTLGEGLNFKNPLSYIYKVSTAVVTKEYQITSQTGQIYNEQGEATGGGQFVTYQISVSYNIPSSNAGKFYKEFGNTVVPEDFLKSKVRESVQNHSTDYDVFGILKGDVNEVRSKTQEDLETVLAKHNIRIVSFVINDVDAGTEIESIVKAEAEAAKQVEIKAKEQIAQTIQLEMDLAKAKNDALVEQALAEGKAEAEKILKSVTVNAIQNMYNSQFEDEIKKEEFETSQTGGYLTLQEVSDIVIKQLYYDTWDGKLPEVISDGTGGISIILPN